MEETRKRTDRKSRNAKSSSRVVDMSWAAKYLDDDWENKYSAEGACDTRVALPVGDRKGESGEGSREEAILKPDLSETQTFGAFHAGLHSDEEENEDDTGISDAVTDEPIASMEEDVKSDEPDDDPIRIRDAVTDKTMVNVEEARVVRTALFQMGFDEDLEDLEGLRDARINRFAKAAQPAAVKADVPQPAADPAATVKLSAPIGGSEAELKDPVFSTPVEKTSSAATIVASKETKSVRKAASETLDLEDYLVPEKEPAREKKVRSRQTEKAKKEHSKTTEPERREVRKNTRQRPAYRDDYYDDRGDGRNYRYDHGERYQYEYMPSKSPLRFIPVVLVIALCVFGFIAAREISHDVPLNASDYSKVKYTVTEGLTDAQLAQDLESMGIISNQLIFRIRCIFYSADYVEGTYELSPCYSTEKIINILSGYTYGTDD